MKILHVLGWPLLILGLVVVLAALLYVVILDQELQQQWFIAETRSQFLRAAELEQRRALLSARPVLLVGAGLTALGLVLLEIRRRLANRA